MSVLENLRSSIFFEEDENQENIQKSLESAAEGNKQLVSQESLRKSLANGEIKNTVPTRK